MVLNALNSVLIIDSRIVNIFLLNKEIVYDCAFVPTLELTFDYLNKILYTVRKTY